MKTLIALMASVSLAAALSAVELPGGSNAQLQATDATGYILLVNGRSEYLVSLPALLGIQPKNNGRGCVLLIQTESGVQQTEVATGKDDILAAVKASRPK